MTKALARCLDDACPWEQEAATSVLANKEAVKHAESTGHTVRVGWEFHQDVIPHA